MKRSSGIAVGVLVALVGVWAVKERSGGPTAPSPLSIDGYVGSVSDAELRVQTKDKLPPVKKLTVKRKDESMVLEQQPQALAADATPDKSKPVEAKWTVKRTRNGGSSEAKAQSYRANAMAEVFGRSIRSTFSREVKPAALADYGLDAAHAIDVEVEWDGHKASLRVGNLDKGSEGSEPTTWVQDPARPAVVFQVAGRDLRGPFEVPWADLRDRSLLNVDLAAVARLEVVNPADLRATRFAVERPALAANAAREPGEGWSITEPQGYPIGDAADWVRSLERLSASEFLTQSEVAAAKADTGLDDPKVAATVAFTAGNTKTVLVFGKVDEAAANKDVWMRIEGRDEVYKVASYSRDQVLVKFDQIRQRSLLGSAKAKDAQSIVIAGPTGKTELSKAGQGWQIAGAGPASGSAVESYLSDLDGMQVDFASDVSAGVAGLATPEWRIQVTSAAGVAVSVALSPEKDKQVLGLTEIGGTKGHPFRLQEWNASKLRKSAADFEDKRLLQLGAAQITSVESRPASGEGFSVSQAKGGWQWTAAGKSDLTKSKAVTEWIATLVSLERGATTAKRPAEVGLDKAFASLKVTGQDGMAVTIGISSEKLGDDVYVSVSSAAKGTQVVTVAAATVATLTKPAAEFASDAAEP